MQKLFLLIACLTVFVSCNKGKNRKFVRELEKATGKEYEIILHESHTEGYIVVQDEETGAFEAYNTSLYERKMSYDDYVAIAKLGTDIVLNLELHEKQTNTPGWISNWVTYYEGDWVWVDTSYYVDDEYYDSGCDCWVDDGYWVEDGYSEWDPYAHSYEVDEGNYGVTSSWNTWFVGNGMIFEEGDSNSKDLETVMGIKEDEDIAKISTTLTSSFGLSETRSLELATLYGQYGKLSSMRELSSDEKKEFEITAFGSDLKEFEEAFKQRNKGDATKMNELLKKASKLNGISPEATNDLVNTLLGNITERIEQ